MRLIIPILLVVALSGCSKMVNGWILNKADSICNEREGIDYITVLDVAYVRCLDGTLHAVEP